ncbi:MAG: zinc dependent phospholipase C family protein [Clostridia bacterium]|nr:zinc dependent phospholipase C family protein [Clostridia bacterium]
MPDVAQHHAFGQRVKATLPKEIQQYLADVPYTFALYGPDPWFMHQPWKRRQGRGRRMHTTKTGAFLTALAHQAKEGAAPRETFSYLAGFLCHYALDSTAHPYIIWQSTETWPTKRAHRDLEHALDAALLKREGHWGERHPVTDYHFPRLQLPKAMAGDLDAAYGAVYGWRNVLPALNRCYPLYRWLFRQMEKPHSLLTLLSRVVPTHRFRSIPYVRSAFLDRDVENLSHQPWHQAYAREMTSTESFPDLFEKAVEMAADLIIDSYAFALQGTMTEAELAQRIGNRSYLSGLDVEDPRNMAVRSLRPSD